MFSAEPECFSWRWQLRSAAKSIRLVIFRNWVGHKKKMENWNVVPCLKQAKRAESTSGFGGVSDRPAIYFIQKKLKFGSPLFNGFDSIRRKMWCNVMEQLHSMAALWRIGRKCTRSWSIRGEFPSSIMPLNLSNKGIADTKLKKVKKSAINDRDGKSYSQYIVVVTLATKSRWCFYLFS